MYFPFKGCGWAVRRQAISVPFTGDTTTWPGKSIKKGEACAFHRIAKHSWKRKTFKMTCGMGREETRPGGRLQHEQEVEGARISPAAKIGWMGTDSSEYHEVRPVETSKGGWFFMKRAVDLGNSLPKMVWVQGVCGGSKQTGLVLGREILGLSA